MAKTEIQSGLMIQALNQSVQDVYYILLNRKMKVGDIAKRSRYSPRTVRHALKTLSNLRLVSQIPDMSDLRSHYYVINTV